MDAIRLFRLIRRQEKDIRRQEKKLADANLKNPDNPPTKRVDVYERILASLRLRVEQRRQMPTRNYGLATGN